MSISRKADPILVHFDTIEGSYNLHIDRYDYGYWLELLAYFLSTHETIVSKTKHKTNIENNHLSIIQGISEQMLQLNPNSHIDLLLSSSGAKLLLSMLRTYKTIFGEDDIFIQIKTENYIERLDQINSDLQIVPMKHIQGENGV